MSLNLFGQDKCDDCGRFVRANMPGASLAEIFDFAAMQPDHTALRCPSCTNRLGPVQSNAMPCDGDLSRYQTVISEVRGAE